jgi:hypothetical protein
MSVQPFNSRISLCISLDFSPHSSIFDFEKHCFQLIISHYGVSNNCVTHVYKPTALEGFLSGVISSLGTEVIFHQILPLITTFKVEKIQITFTS